MSSIARYPPFLLIPRIPCRQTIFGRDGAAGCAACGFAAGELATGFADAVGAFLTFAGDFAACLLTGVTALAFLRGWLAGRGLRLPDAVVFFRGLDALRASFFFRWSLRDGLIANAASLRRFDRTVFGRLASCLRTVRIGRRILGRTLRATEIGPVSTKRASQMRLSARWTFLTGRTMLASWRVLVLRAGLNGLATGLFVEWAALAIDLKRPRYPFTGA